MGLYRYRLKMFFAGVVFIIVAAIVIGLRGC